MESRQKRVRVKVVYGAHIRKLRHEMGWSEEELAAEAGVSASYLSQLERGLRNPSLDKLEAIYDALGHEMAAFLKM